MQDWRLFFRNGLQDAVKGDLFWESCLKSMLDGQAPFGLHLAILIEPYLEYILDGKKTVESRFSERRIAPYGRVQKDDIILLKRSSGPIVGLCQVANIWYYKLNPESWHEIKNEFAQMLCAQDPAFWEQRKSAEFATLMRLSNVHEIAPIKYPKSDRRGWVVLRSGGEIFP